MSDGHQVIKQNLYIIFAFVFRSSSAIIGGYQPSSTYSFSGYQPQVTPFSSTGYGGVPNTNHMFPMTSNSGVTPVTSTQVKFQVMISLS